jgi:hypothetical protein
MTSSAMNWFNINRNIPVHGVTNNFNFIAINNAATCYGDVHNKLFISFDKVLNNSLPSGITLSGRFSLELVQYQQKYPRSWCN